MKLFVYGTLLSDQPAHENLAEIGARMVESHDTIIGGMATMNLQYPHIEIHETDCGWKVHGEVYDIGDGSLEKCDKYEGYNPNAPERCLFTRSTVITSLGHEVMVYHAGPRLHQYLELNKVPVIPIDSGSWREFIENERPMYTALKKMWQNEIVQALADAGMLKKAKKQKSQSKS